MSSTTYYQFSSSLHADSLLVNFFPLETVKVILFLKVGYSQHIILRALVPEY